MHKLYALKDMLIKELSEYGDKDLSAGTLDVVDKLAHATKNLCKVIETCEEEGYSSSDGDGGASYEGGASYDGGSSYARRRDSRGRYARRGYSRRGYEDNYYRSADDITRKLNELMEEAPDERTRSDIKRLISKMETM